MSRRLRELTRRTLLAGSAAAPIAAFGPCAMAAPAIVKAGGTVDYWTFLNPKDNNARSVAQNMMLESFHKKYPNIDINITVFPWQTIDQQLTLAVKARRAPDLSRANLELMAQHAGANNVMPLDQYVSDWSDEQKGQFTVPWETTVFNGHKMSFYIEARAAVLMYRKDLIKEPPQSWDELGRIGARLAAPPRFGISIPLSEKGHATGLYEWFLPAIAGAGGDFFTPRGNAAFASDAGIRCYQLLHDLVHEYKAMPAAAVSDDIESVTQNMMAGTDTMGFIGTHRITLMWTGKATTRDTLGVGYIPSFEKGKPSPTFSDGWQLVIPHGAKNPDGAWALLQHICLEPQSQLDNLKVGGELPSLATVLDDPWFDTADGANFAFAIKYLKASNRNIHFPRTWDPLMDKLALAAQQVVARQQSAADALAAVAKEFDGWTN
jgi:multiple sugar transport system substrate-binding protein